MLTDTAVVPIGEVRNSVLRRRRPPIGVLAARSFIDLKRISQGLGTMTKAAALSYVENALFDLHVCLSRPKIA
jgi:hypothetical protein